MGKEIEIKYLLDENQIETLLKWPPVQMSESSVKRVVSTYFDTPEADLRHQKIAYRVRQAGDTWLQTVKGMAPSVDGLSVREEVETTLLDDQPDFAAFKGSAFENLFSDNRFTSRLRPLFVTDFQRTKWLIQHESSIIEMVLDQGKVIASHREEPILEVEMELKSGNPQDLATCGQALLNFVSLRPGNESKAQRGYRLAANEQNET